MIVVFRKGVRTEKMYNISSLPCSETGNERSDPLRGFSSSPLVPGLSGG